MKYYQFDKFHKTDTKTETMEPLIERILTMSLGYLVDTKNYCILQRSFLSVI